VAITASLEASKDLVKVPLSPEKDRMSDEKISATDQDRERVRSMARLLALAERELAAFVAAVNELFDAEQAWQAADNWLEELARTDGPSETLAIDWRRVTIAAASKLGGRDKGRLPRN
jgi:hypothetical protein